MACDETCRFFKGANLILCILVPCFEYLFFSILSIRKEDIEHMRIITCAIKSDSQSFAVRNPNPKPAEKLQEKCPLD